MLPRVQILILHNFFSRKCRYMHACALGVTGVFCGLKVREPLNFFFACVQTRTSVCGSCAFKLYPIKKLDEVFLYNSR